MSIFLMSLSWGERIMAYLQQFSQWHQQTCTLLYIIYWQSLSRLEALKQSHSPQAGHQWMVSGQDSCWELGEWRRALLKRARNLHLSLAEPCHYVESCWECQSAKCRHHETWGISPLIESIYHINRGEVRDSRCCKEEILTSTMFMLWYYIICCMCEPRGS